MAEELDPIRKQLAGTPEEEPRDIERKKKNLREVMMTDVGMDFLMDVLEDANIYADQFNSDPIIMARNCGWSAFGQELRHNMRLTAPLRLVEAEQRRAQQQESKR